MDYLSEKEMITDYARELKKMFYRTNWRTLSHWQRRRTGDAGH